MKHALTIAAQALQILQRAALKRYNGSMGNGWVPAKFGRADTYKLAPTHHLELIFADARRVWRKANIKT